MNIKAIPTFYNGHFFRSRLEARWAVFFDNIGLEWDYEIEGFELGNGERYLPDFYFPQINYFGEVKPDYNKSEIVDAFLKRSDLSFKTGKRCLLLFGKPKHNGLWATVNKNDCDEIGWEMIDVAWTGDRLWALEGRMFVSTGIDAASYYQFAFQEYGDGSDDFLDEARKRANCARFEHGYEGNTFVGKKDNFKYYR